MVTTPIIEEGENGKLYPGYLDRYKTIPHLGPYLLGGFLFRNDFDIHIVDLVHRNTFDQRFAEELSEYDIVFLSANSTNWSGCVLLIHWLKEINPCVTIVVGGIHPTLFFEDIIRRFPVDFAVRGEGERVLIPLLHAIETDKGWENVPGLVSLNESDSLLCNPNPSLLETSELNVLPLPLFEQMPSNHYQTLPIESSRGCIGSCAFCAIPYKRIWRPISSEAFVNRIEEYLPFLSKTKGKVFSIVDDCFTIDHERALSIIQEIERRRIDFQAEYDARVVDFLDEKLVERLACHSQGILVGAESFLPETLRKVNKPVTPKMIRECAKITAKYRMAEQMIFSFIIGFPWESKRQIQENISQIVDLALTYGVKVLIQWHSLTPGSAIWQSFMEKQLVSIADLDEVGYLIGKKWFNLSSSLSIDERLDISDIIICARKAIIFTKSINSRLGDILFSVPPYLNKNPDLTKEWRNVYEQKMTDLT
jgi:radical SAM superfamily enzyme YgiQ (UPF0313 family)